MNYECRDKKLARSRRNLKSVKMAAACIENPKTKDSASDIAVHPENRMQQLIDQSLVGLMYIALMAIRGVVVSCIPVRRYCRRCRAVGGLHYFVCRFVSSAPDSSVNSDGWCFISCGIDRHTCAG